MSMQDDTGTAASAEGFPPNPQVAAGSTRFALAIRASPIHRYGVYAVEPIAAGERVIEYRGERISYWEAARRSGRALIYLFWAAPGRIIDGAVGGSGAEFINHSCEPNLVADIVDGHVYFASLRNIAAGEELLLDYKVQGHDEAIPCRCGAPSCRGYLNAV